MFKYLLLKAIFELSDVVIVERSKYDMSFKYFLGMAAGRLGKSARLGKARKVLVKIKWISITLMWSDASVVHSRRAATKKVPKAGAIP
jgi:hypothetical protein